jgi:tRNA threonylcarbamoyladenosine biosynthesis protein TsaE
MARPLTGGRIEVGAAPLRIAVRSTSTATTIALGERLGRVAERGDLVCLWGELGAGKTQIAKGFALGLGISTTITSPSFILMAEHPGRIRLFHVDLYRLADAADALAGGVVDDRQADGLTVVEWPDRMGDVLPRDRLDIRIEGSGDEPRTVVVETATEAYRRYLEAASK